MSNRDSYACPPLLVKPVAVVDVETTGLDPITERVVEIGIVLLDEYAQPMHTFTSLIRAESDTGTPCLGPQHIHKIDLRDLAFAPTYAELSHQIASLLNGRVLAAHYAQFDIAFLAKESALLGQSVYDLTTHTVCTLALGEKLLPPGSRSLISMCERAKIKLLNNHMAINDALNASALLAHLAKLSPLKLGEVTNFSTDFFALHSPVRPVLRGKHLRLAKYLSTLVNNHHNDAPHSLHAFIQALSQPLPATLNNLSPISWQILSSSKPEREYLLRWLQPHLSIPDLLGCTRLLGLDR